jgi:hypothetical protein
MPDEHRSLTVLNDLIAIHSFVERPVILFVSDAGTGSVLNDIVPFEKLVDAGSAADVATIVEEQSGYP